MTTRPIPAGLACLILAASGCASQAPRQVAGPAARPASDAQDIAYIAQVEQQARRRGLQVQWVNPPRRRSAAVE